MAPRGADGGSRPHTTGGVTMAVGPRGSRSRRATTPVGKAQKQSSSSLSGAQSHALVSARPCLTARWRSRSWMHTIGRHRTFFEGTFLLRSCSASFSNCRLHGTRRRDSARSFQAWVLFPRGGYTLERFCWLVGGARALAFEAGSFTGWHLDVVFRSFSWIFGALLVSHVSDCKSTCFMVSFASAGNVSSR